MCKRSPNDVLVGTLHRYAARTPRLKRKSPLLAALRPWRYTRLNCFYRPGAVIPAKEGIQL